VDHEKLAERLRTVHAINVIQFREDRGVDYDLLERNIEFLIASGLGVIVPCGNTGEFYALSAEEAQAVTRFVVERVGGRTAVLAGISYDLGTAREMALAAQNAGADAVMVHQPVHPYLMTEGLIRYYAGIARCVEIGVVPYARHEAIDREVLSRVADIENVLAIKYAINDLPRFTDLVQSVEASVVWVCGTVEMWVPFFFAAGAEGFTSGLDNIAPELSLTVLDGLRRGDSEAVRTVWRHVAPIERLRARNHNGNNVSVIKEGMNLAGLPAGLVREPLGELDEADRQELTQILRSWGKLA
jgi:4-hydroxy-tetrahydrodipicolinate synthase